MHYTINDKFYGCSTFAGAVRAAKSKALDSGEATITCISDSGTALWRVAVEGGELIGKYFTCYSDYDSMSTEDLIIYLDNQTAKSESALYMLVERATDAGFDIREFEHDDLQAEFNDYRNQLIEAYEKKHGETCLDADGNAVEGSKVPNNLEDMETTDIYERLLPHLATVYEYPNWLYEDAASWFNYDLRI